MGFNCTNTFWYGGILSHLGKEKGYVFPSVERDARCVSSYARRCGVCKSHVGSLECILQTWKRGWILISRNLRAAL